MKSEESTFKPALMLMSGRLAAFAVTFFSGPLLARIFSQTEFGTYRQILLIVATLFALAQFGFAECLYYFLPGNPEASGRYAFNSLLMLGAMGVLCGIGLLVNPAQIGEWLSNSDLSHYMFLAGLLLVFMLMGTVLETTLICRKRFRLATVSYVASDVLRVAFLLVPAIITRNLDWTLIGGITFCCSRFLMLLGFLRKEFGVGFRFDASLLRDQFIYALPFSVYVALHTIQNNYHQYAVSYYFDAATFAIYSVGCLQIPLVDFMATPAVNVMMVQMREHLRERRLNRLLNVWHDTTRKLAFVLFPLTGVLIVNAFPMITLLYTNAYSASVPVFMLWSLSILFAAFQTDGVLRAFAENRWLMITNILRLAAIASLMSWFLSTFDLIGAVLVTLSGIVIAKITMLIVIKRLLQASMARLLPLKELGAI
jgi:O-antigen/teichoic acid export membrane protein